MIKRRVIRVFEHDVLRYGQSYHGVRFSEDDFNALTRFNERENSKFFSVVHKGIKFSQFVGVVQVGNLVIEILPKSDSFLSDNSPEEQKLEYRKIFLHLLRQSHLLSFEEVGISQLQLRDYTLLDMYILEFLKEVHTLLHRGLTKQYVVKEENRASLTGQLRFPKHLRLNLVHKERFYVRHQCYEFEHLLNQIIRKALVILSKSIQSGSLVDHIQRAIIEFPDVEIPPINKSTFGHIVFSRKTDRYRKAIDLAKMIILGFSPDLSAGRENVISFLFDMNDLWERYVYCELKRNEENFDYRVTYQKGKRFWESRTVRPDIILTTQDKKFVIDTKWKILERPAPSDDDLKQMFVYNNYFDSEKSLLLYPNVFNLEARCGRFHKPMIFSDGGGVCEHGCTVGFVSLVENGPSGTLPRGDLAQDILNILWC